ncbi:MAG TPA: ABC transporter ATP-binding protein [Acidimicrobiales bacterium]
MSDRGFTRVRVDPFDGVEQRPGVGKPDPILVMDHVTRRFGGLTAVAVEHLEFQRGVISGLIGPNGAGKTTLFNVVTGFDRANTGDWRLNGEAISHLSAHHVARKGLVRTFQLTKALSRLTVLDNMMLGATGQVGERFLTALLRRMWHDQESGIQERADALLERFNLAHMRDEFAGTLSGGQRKLLELARALMVQPDIVMLDEPMAGVNPALAQSIMRHVQDLRDEGLTVVFVEHDMDVVREISEWVVVMAEGQVIAEGRHATIVSDPLVIDAYLGAHHGTPLDPVEQERQLAESELALEAESAASAAVERRSEETS